MLYGILYFFNVDDIYNENSYIKYIRFGVVFVYFIVNIDSVMIDRLCIWIFTALMLFILFMIASNSATYDWLNYINFILPTLIPICCPSLISRSVKINKLCLITYVVSCVFAYIEYFFFGGLFTRFSRSGYRVISIFVNPNNFGIILAILTCVLLYNFKFSNAYKLIMVVNSLFVIYLTGCRTALISLIIVLLLYVLQNIDLTKEIQGGRIILFMSISYVLIGLIVYLTHTELHLDVRDLMNFSSNNSYTLSNDARMDANLYFFSQVKKHPFYPWTDEIKNLDNMYFYIWGRFGFLVFLSYILWQLFTLKTVLLKKNNLHIVLWIVFFLAGITTNFLYLWPLGYFYWYYISCVMKKDLIDERRNLK